MSALGAASGRFRSACLAAALLAVAPPIAAAPAAAPSPLPAAVPATSAPRDLDLGEGLAFFRAPTLPADLPPPAARPGPLVLDLRFTTADDSATTALAAWLQVRATPTTPVFVLINADTAASLRKFFAAAPPRAGLLTLGSAAPDFTPDIVIPSSEGADRRAYDALEHGATVASLTVENPDKPRTDEAAIVRERTNPSVDPEVDADDGRDDFPENKPDDPKPAPVIDRALQRAIHVHRALLALKRL